jgi:hypothetical protein
MSDRFLATVALVVWCVAALVAVLFGLPLLLTLLVVHVDAGLIVSVVTAGIALAAALIAYQSVSRQIKANADIVAAQIAADRSERRRAERIDVVDDALTLVDRLAQEALNYEYWSGRQNSPYNEEREQSARRAFFDLETLPIRQKLELLGLSEASEAVEAVWEQTRLVIEPFPEAPFNEERAAASTARQRMEHAKALLKAALSEA